MNKKIPTVVRNILIETYYDFKDMDVGDDVSKTNLKNILTDIKNGKDVLNMLESSILFEYFYKGYDDFRKSKQLDDDRLESDTLNYYEYLQNIYYDNSGDIDYRILNPYKSQKTQTMIKNSIDCENFIVIHYIKNNFNIVYFEDDLMVVF